MDLSRIISKQIYLYGMGVFGVALMNYLKRRGAQVVGAFDKNNLLCGIKDIPVYDPAIIRTILGDNDVVIVSASNSKSITEIAEYLDRIGLVGDEQYVLLQEQMYISIDIVNYCGLHCKSCAVGNANRSLCPTKTMKMEMDNYVSIIEKIKRDFPNNLAIYLYAFGDPVLHPQVHDFIRIAHEHGLMVEISTSLSYDMDLSMIIKECPDTFKVSVSGFNNSEYIKTHGGGDIRLVKSNLYKMRYLMDRYKKDFPVVIGYHVYKGSSEEEIQCMGELCNELGYIFQPVNAIYNGILKYSGIDAFTESDIAFIREQYNDPEEVISPSAKYQKYCGLWDSHIAIDATGEYVLCCAVYGSAGEYHRSFLDGDFEEYKNWRRQSMLCKTCLQYGYGQGMA